MNIIQTMTFLVPQQHLLRLCIWLSISGYSNSFMESFFSTLKGECVERTRCRCLQMEYQASLLYTCDTMKTTLRRGNIYQGRT
jgi:hypothetical protein